MLFAAWLPVNNQFFSGGWRKVNGTFFSKPVVQLFMMKKSTGNKKIRWLLWLGLPLILIAALVIFAVSGLNTFLKPTIKRSLAKVVVDGSDSLYRFSVRDYTIGPGGRSAVISGIEVQVDSARYKTLKATGLLPRIVISLSIEKASISGISPWELWKHKNIICSQVAMENIKMNLLQQTRPADSLKNAGTKTLYQLIKPDINVIDINIIKVKNADILYRTVQEQTEKRSWWHFKNTTATVEDIKVDSLAGGDTSRFSYAGNFKISLGAFNMTSSDDVYKLSTKNTDYDFSKKLATIEEFKLLPAITKQEFNKKMGHAADLFTINAPLVSIGAFNPSPLLIDSRIEAGLITLDKPDIEIYKDNTAPYDTRSKVGKYPHQLLMKAGMPISIKAIKIEKGKLLVTQRSRKTGEAGSFSFHNVRGSIKNITNDTAEVQKNKWCRADLNAGFMGANNMHAVFAFDLASRNGHFTTDASLQSLEAKDINPAFRALARADLQQFHLNKMNYHVEGYDGYAIGNLQLLYRDLKLELLKEQDGELKKKGLISFLANMLKIYDNNPVPGEPERKAINIRDQRLPEKNFFGLIVRTLLKCTQEITLKGKNKELPGLSGKQPGKGDKK